MISENEDEEKHELKLHLTGAERPITFGVEPDSSSFDEDEEGPSSQLQRLFFELEVGSEDEIVSFYDEDDERVYIRAAEVLAIEVPSICCEPTLWNAYVEGLDEDEKVTLSSVSEPDK
jgi:hypothetical protein